MGARTQYTIRTNGQDLNLYSHWGGEDKANTFARALDTARPRWSDDSYFLRILFSQIIGEAWNELTGFGIAVNEEFEESYSSLCLDLGQKQISYMSEIYTYPEFVERFI